MNYIKHLSGFFNRVAKDDRLNPSHVSMYVSLFQFWNASRFENPISISRSELMTISKICSKSTYHKCIRDLHDFGFLRYMPSYNPLKGSLVYLLGFEETAGQFSGSTHTGIQTGSEQVPVRSRPENEPGTEQALVPYLNTLNINKHTNSLNLEEAETDFHNSNASKKNKVERSEIPTSFGKKSSVQILNKAKSQPDSLGKKIPPGFELVREFFAAHGWAELEAEKYYNYFCSNGWLVGGKSPMKDWKAAARNWMLNAKSLSNDQNRSLHPGHLHAATGKITQSPFDYSDVWQWLETKGKSVYGSKFRLHKEDSLVINMLICYFLQDSLSAPFFNVNLEKGIFLSGPVDCGKTSLMNLLRFIAMPAHRYAMKPCRDISFEFIRDGYDVIHRYSRVRAGKFDLNTFCFDDLGTEKNIKYYGNECNVMAEVLLSRYDLFVSRGLITHLTTNLSASEIETAYGNRLRSRLREMFNLISFNTNSKDKRK